MNNPKILIELVPKTCWFSNVRSQVSSSDWDKLRKEAYNEAQHRCNVCHRKVRLEAHEIWHYNDNKQTQKLHGLTAVCKSCHELYHLGFASINGKLPQAISWLSKINDWSKFETEEFINIIFEIWYQRSQKTWTLDLTFLDNKKIKYDIISPEERVDFAKKYLRS